LHGNAEAIWLTKGNQKVVFDIKIHTPKGVVFCMNLQCKVQFTEKEVVVMTINDAHDRFGHVHGQGDNQGDDTRTWNHTLAWCNGTVQGMFYRQGTTEESANQHTA
jgi:hypothetical protein